MSNEEKKEYLSAYIDLKRSCKILEDDINEFMLGRYLPGMPASGIPSAHNKKDLSDVIIKYDCMCSKLIAKRYAKIVKYHEISDAIDSIEGLVDAKQVLRLRYLSGKRWESICEMTGYSWKQVHRLHGKALNVIQIPELSTKDDIE